MVPLEGAYGVYALAVIFTTPFTVAPHPFNGSNVSYLPRPLQLLPPPRALVPPAPAPAHPATPTPLPQRERMYVRFIRDGREVCVRPVSG